MQELWLIFSTTFLYSSNKCLYREAGAAALIAMFQLGMPCQDKIASQEKNFFYFG